MKATAVDAGFDSFHLPADDNPWWTETSWFSFLVPERRLSGTVYTWFRPNLGVCTAGVVVWDDTAELPWEVVHYDYQWHLPMPEDDLTDVRLPNGLRVRCLEPACSYAVEYERDGTALDLRFDGITEPHEVPMARLAFVGSAHFDQHGRVTGTLRLDGEEIPIDCVAVRDRSWGPRSDLETGIRAGYCTGAASETEAFHSISVWRDGAEEIVAGYLLREGELHDLVGGSREVERADGRPARIRLEAQDRAGRVLDVHGECVNRLAFPARAGNIVWMSLTRWELDGATGWGEDQDVWSPGAWRSFLRHA